MEHSENHDPKLGSYLIGFVLAVVLTAIPFTLVAMNALSTAGLFATIAIAGIVQVFVHLKFFLHLSLKHTPSENILALAFAGVLVMIMIGGTLWIMFNIGFRHAM
ncbi:MAG: cytochrome o ubiquinol oxidase subunit IV [Pseudomonadota bacterium]